MKSLLFAGILFFSFSGFAQDSTKSDLHQTAKSFIRSGDYSNAVLVLNRAISQEPDNIELQKDLAFTYYLGRDYTKALQVAKPITERKDADIQSYQILGMVYKAIEEGKEAEKVYRAGLKRFPQSGLLYNELGEVQFNRKNLSDAIETWEKGISVDPNASGNYYNASKYYFGTNDLSWAIIYGEIFLNLESYSKRTPEIKSLLLEAYKRLFSRQDVGSARNGATDFEKNYLSVMQAQSKMTVQGITPESISALRTRFILDWFEKNGNRLPFRLFDYHQQLLKGGMFDAYNQWIFGAANDLAAYQTWTNTHPEEFNKFNTFQRNRVFKLPSGQYYQSVK